MMVRGRMIEKLGESEPDPVNARPIQIAKDDAVSRLPFRIFKVLELLWKVHPALTVVDQAIDPGPKLRNDRIVKLPLPPKIKRQIRIQLREDNVREETGAWTAQQKRELLGANLFAASAIDVA